MSFVNEYTLNVDIKRSTSNVVPTFKQGETARLKFKIFDNGKLYDLTSFTNAEITFNLPNGDTTIGTPILENGFIVYNFQGTEMEQVGDVTVILTIISGDTEVSVQPFKIFIYDRMKNENLTYIRVLQDLIAETQQVELNALDVIDQMNTTRAELEQDVVDYKSEINTFNSHRTHLKAWNITTQYVTNNEVEFNGSTWRALRDNIGVTPVEGLDWTLIARKGTDGNGTVGIYRESYVATEGQRNFTTENKFDQFQNRARVTVNGVLQKRPDNYEEISSQIISFNEGLPAGYKVEIEYFGEAVPIADDVRTVVTTHTEEISKFNNQGIYEEKFIATEGQSIFTLTTTTYEPLQHKIEVFVEGIRQESGSNYTESSDKMVTLSEGVPAGTEVVVKYYGKRIPIVTDVEATLNTHANQIGNHTTEIGSLTTQLAHIAVNVKSFGAVGDNITDDTLAIRDAIEYAKLNKLNLYFPPVSIGYKTTDTIHIDADIDVIMDSPIIYHGVSDRVVLKYGDTSFNLQKRTSKVQAYKYYDWSSYDVDWSNENCIAVQLVNAVESYIEVIEASNCTIGLQLVGDTKAFSYSRLSLGRLYNNKKPISLTCNGDVKGYVTETRVTGGRIGYYSAVNLDQSRYGITGIMNNTNVFDGLIFDGQSYEMNHDNLTNGAEGIPFLLEDFNTCNFVNFRSEANEPNIMARTYRCYKCEFEPLKISSSGSAVLEMEPPPQGYNTNKNRSLYSEVEVFNVNRLTDNVKYYPIDYATKRIILNKLFNVFMYGTSFDVANNIRDFMTYTKGTSPIESDGVKFLDSIHTQNVAFGLDTENHKIFKIRKNGIARVGMLCFDENDNYLTPTASSNYVKGGYMNFDTSYFNGLYMQPNGGENDYKELLVEVSMEVKKVIVFFGASNRGAKINNLSVSAVYFNTLSNITTLRTWNPINTDKKLFPYSSSIPAYGKMELDEIWWNTTRTAGGYIGWVPVTEGTANNIAWVASKSYTVGQRVNVNNKVYECTVAGTSGTTSPNHSTGDAVDGTVTWKYIDALSVIKGFGIIEA